MNFDQMMNELKEEYIASFPDKIADIKQHYEGRDQQKLRDDFHKLKGTGKTYGLPEVSILGELVEKMCMEKTLAPALFVPLAIQLLEEIYTFRIEKKPFPIEDHANYTALLQLLHKVDSSPN